MQYLRQTCAGISPKSSAKCMSKLLRRQQSGIAGRGNPGAPVPGMRGPGPQPGMQGNPPKQPPPGLIGIERPPPKRTQPIPPPPGARAPSSATSQKVGAGKDVIVEVDASNFAETVLKARVAVILDVYADWCQPCKQLTPMLEKVVTAASGGLRLAKLNADTQQQLAAQLGVKSLPTVFGVVGGRVVDSFTGVVPEPRIREFLEKLISAAEGAGLVPQEGEAGQGEGAEEPDVAIQAASMLTGVSTYLEHGRAPEAAAILDTLLPQLRELVDAYHIPVSDESTAGGLAGKPRRKPTASPVPPEVQELMCRALAACVRAQLQIAQSAASAGNTAQAKAALAKAIEVGGPIVGGTEYRSAASNVEVQRGVAAAQLAATAAEVVEDAKAVLSLFTAAPIEKASDPVLGMRAVAALIAVGDLPAASTAALDMVRYHPGWNNGAAPELARRIFTVLGDAHSATQVGRKRMAKLLFR